MWRRLLSLKLSAILGIVCLVLIALHYIGVLVFFENIVIRVLAPVQTRIFGIGSGFQNVYTSVFERRDIAAHYDELKASVDRLTIENSQLKALLDEEQAASVQQDYLARNKITAVTARVIGKNPEPNLQAIIIDKGSNDGVAVDQPIITGDGILVGKISSVRSRSAQAILINDSRSRIAAVVQNDVGSKGVVVGEHGLSLRMELIPKNEQIAEDMVVTTSGLESSVPRGLVIGKVSRILAEENSSFQTAFIQSLSKLDNIMVVSVLLGATYD